KDVIIDGEEVTLTEVGDSLSELKTTTLNNWYEVKFKADETVKSVTLINPAIDRTTGSDLDAANHGDYQFCIHPGTVDHPLGGVASGKYPRFVGKIEDVEKAQEDNTTGKVILFEDMYTNNHAMLNGEDTYGEGLKYTLDTAGTSLQVKNATGGTVKGFAVSGNAKTVLVQDKRVINKDGEPISVMDSIEYFDGGRSGLERAVKKLNLNNKVAGEYFRGFVSAVFENGVAQTVIIYEKLPNDVNWGGDETPSNIQVTIANGKITVTPKTPVGGTVTDEKLMAVRNALLKAGYENINIARDNTGKVTGITATKDDITTTFGHEGLNPLVVSSISVSGTPTKDTYVEGEAFDPAGLTITVNYADGSSDTLANLTDATYVGGNSGNAALQTSDTTVTVTYAGQTATVSGITVSARTVDSFTASVTAGTTIEAAFGSAITKGQLTGLSLEVSYVGGGTAMVSGTDAGVTVQAGQSVGTKGNQPITIEYGGKTSTVSVAVDPTTSGTVSGALTGFTISGAAFTDKAEGDTISVTYTADSSATVFDQAALNALATSVTGTGITNGTITLTTPGTADSSAGADDGTKAVVTVSFELGPVTNATTNPALSFST
ncbi:MAG: hypothetical protein HFG09_10345, partial [Oscillibacter sp.]|nr:hypothetical protein [Oscillibacter sp.]